MKRTIRQSDQRQIAIKGVSNPTYAFSGTTCNSDITNSRQGDLLEYYLILRNVVIRGTKLLVKKAELGIGTRHDLSEKPIDINKQIRLLEKEMEKYEKLYYVNPDYIGPDGLSYKEIVMAFRDNLNELKMAESRILRQAELQIRDKFNTEEQNDIREVNFQKMEHEIFNHKKIISGFAFVPIN